MPPRRAGGGVRHRPGGAGARWCAPARRGFARLTRCWPSSDADCVVLATPSGLHPRQASRPPRPAARDDREADGHALADGLAMVAACDEAGVRLFVVKQNRRNRHAAAAEAGASKALRPHLHGQRQRLLDSGRRLLRQRRWRGTWEFDGGAFMNQASHYVDLLDWLIGPVESVHGLHRHAGRNIEVEDTGVAALRWRSGALGSINVTMLTYPKNLEGSITILGEKGTCASAAWRSTRSSTGSSPTAAPDDAELVKATPATRPPRSTALATRCTTTTSSSTLRGEAEPRPTAARA
jgi:UDP-N-acetyl-2-amino-2-deoxyglucuronate dehydrogenase